MRAGKHVLIEIPMADSLADAERVVEVQRGNRAGGDGGPRPPLQPEPPVGAQPDRGRRAEAAAPGVRDVLLPPHQHERARPAAELDRPPAVAPRLPHRRSLPVPDRRGPVARPRASGPAPPQARHRHGHEHRHGGAVGRGVHAVALVQQRRAARHVLPLHLRQRHLDRPLR